MVSPQAVGSAKGRHAAVGGNAGAGEHDNRVSGGETFLQYP
jgi:hypothetical protein